MTRLLHYRTYTATVSGRRHLWSYHCHTCGDEGLRLSAPAARAAAMHHLHTHNGRNPK